MAHIGTDDEIWAWGGSPENAIQRMLEPERKKGNMAKKKKKTKRPKHKCDGNCAECPNFGTKNCVNYVKRKKGVKKKKKIIRKIVGR